MNDLSEEARERDREMQRRIEELQKKRLRGERLTDREWELVHYGGFQACHCSGSTGQRAR